MATTTTAFYEKTTPASLLWADEDGRITCRTHAGSYLTHALNEAEKRGESLNGLFHTPLNGQNLDDGWMQMTPEDIARYRYAIRDLPQVWQDYVCESCRGEACRALGTPEFGA